MSNSCCVNCASVACFSAFNCNSCCLICISACASISSALGPFGSCSSCAIKLSSTFRPTLYGLEINNMNCLKASCVIMPDCTSGKNELENSDIERMYSMRSVFSCCWSILIVESVSTSIAKVLSLSFLISFCNSAPCSGVIA